MLLVLTIMHYNAYMYMYNVHLNNAIILVFILNSLMQNHYNSVCR